MDGAFSVMIPLHQLSVFQPSYFACVHPYPTYPDLREKTSLDLRWFTDQFMAFQQLEDIAEFVASKNCIIGDRAEARLPDSHLLHRDPPLSYYRSLIVLIGRPNVVGSLAGAK